MTKANEPKPKVPWPFPLPQEPTPSEPKVPEDVQADEHVLYVVHRLRDGQAIDATVREWAAKKIESLSAQLAEQARLMGLAADHNRELMERIAELEQIVQKVALLPDAGNMVNADLIDDVIYMAQETMSRGEAINAAVKGGE